MFNVNFMLAKAIQKDQLRTAKNGRLARQMDNTRKKLLDKMAFRKVEKH
ncbi:MAG: hypothetical protein R3E39_28120 [Anaerolineae bacterium]